jgi:hypothetical protein
MLRPYVLPVGGNLVFFLWVWLGVNDGKGLFYFTKDPLGLMLLLPTAVLLNASLWLVSYLRQDLAWTRIFGWLVLLLLSGCTSVWVHGCTTGVTS